MIYDARCPKCPWWVRVVRVVETFDGAIKVWGVCKRHGEQRITSFSVWP